MGLMFEEELADITASTIDRVAHDFRKKTGAQELLARLSDYNRRREILFTDELKQLKYAEGGGPGKGVSKAFSLGLVSLPVKVRGEAWLARLDRGQGVGQLMYLRHLPVCYLTN